MSPNNTIKTICMINYIVFMVIILPVCSLHAQTTMTGSFMHGGIKRSYSFYIPKAYDAKTPVPLLIGLHGLGSGGAEFMQYRDFKSIADTANFIIVNPDGSKMLGQRFWNYGKVMGSHIDDIGFLEALIDTIAAHYAINQERIYCVGMSNGSYLTYYMACRSNRLAAIATVTGSMSTTMFNDCRPQNAIPSLHIHGTNDRINPYKGNHNSKSIAAITILWANINGCDTIPAVYPIPDIDNTDDATAIRYVYTNKTNNRTVELYTIKDGEHSWPGSRWRKSKEVTCMDFDACITIWRFLRQYRLTAIVVNK